MRALLITFSNSGGANIAARRIGEAIDRAGVTSTLALAQHTQEDTDDLMLPYRGIPGSDFLRRNIGGWSLWLQKSSNPMHRSINLIPSGALSFVNSPQWDVVHLHWVGSDTLSISDIGRITKPVIWTLHDSWPLGGAEHHPEDAHDERYVEGYTRASRRPGNSRFDLDAWVYRRKQRYWRKPMWLVAPSRTMASMASKSALTSSWPCRVIPNPINTETFAPAQESSVSQRVRSHWNIPATGPIILFGSSPGSVANKGWDLLEPALRLLASRVPNATCVVFGADDLPLRAVPGMRVVHTGYIDDPESLAALYGTATVMVVPSRRESFSQTAAEAQACGTPVVAFRTSGLLDVIDHGVTGFLATPEDPASLSTYIERVLTDEGLRSHMATEARQRAIHLWSPSVVGATYRAWYEEALASHRIA